ncbi:uncharacterized protein N7459_005513 [Penicillium hispanicum]|uniref:uncharacterized protein n=1 Tax=Penicillium hispanicum TaxID=1080232 RepID=UPI00254088C5|nr:uncharacterized protein N7459_005513 [Penicillium hispanicum]KAJ5579528.1 hypothetical protein N7459_005513 [Penicillium hispanicum]
MKVLCLHGKGTSGAIFRSQTASFRAQLGNKDIEFDFLDGTFSSTAAAGVDLFYPPPYYSWYEGVAVDEVRNACARLNEYIAKHGPYDLAMAFSQGCVVASSLLLFHQEETPHLPPPFKAAMFICGGGPLYILEELGFHVSAEAKERDAASRAALNKQAGSTAVLAQGGDRWTGLESLDGGLSEEQLRNEITCPTRISVPTVHVYGTKDPRYAAGVHLSGICDPAKRRTYNHGGGHEIPRTKMVSLTIANLTEWVLAEANGAY